MKDTRKPTGAKAPARPGRRVHLSSNDEQATAQPPTSFARALLDFWNSRDDLPDFLNDALVDAVSGAAELYGLPNPFDQPKAEEQLPLLERVLERVRPAFSLRQPTPPGALDKLTAADITTLVRESAFRETDVCLEWALASLLTLLRAFTYTDSMPDRETYLDAATRCLLPYLSGADKLVDLTVARPLFALRYGAQEGASADEK